ncbi:MAG: glycosyltransferase family 9 protein [Bryobacteraceae bacterium]
MRRLLIRPGAIGDCVISFPALQFLRSDYTEVWAPTPVVPLIQFADRVCSLSSTGLDSFGIDGLRPPDSIIERLASFDEIISWYGANRPEFRIALSRVCNRCVFFEALPRAGTAEHATDFYARQVGAPSGLVPKICTDEPERRRSVIIHPFSGGVRKNWPLPCFQSVASELGMEVEWIAGPEEELPAARRFENLLQLASWIRGASLYIGNDSGITHLAAATGAPTLALFGPTAPEVWAPRGGNVTVLAHDPIAELPVARVLEAANRLLGSP